MLLAKRVAKLLSVLGMRDTLFLVLFLGQRCTLFVCIQLVVTCWGMPIVASRLNTKSTNANCQWTCRQLLCKFNFSICWNWFSCISVVVEFRWIKDCEKYRKSRMRNSWAKSRANSRRVWRSAAPRARCTPAGVIFNVTDVISPVAAIARGLCFPADEPFNNKLISHLSILLSLLSFGLGHTLRCSSRASSTTPPPLSSVKSDAEARLQPHTTTTTTTTKSGNYTVLGVEALPAQNTQLFSAQLLLSEIWTNWWKAHHYH